MHIAKSIVTVRRADPEVIYLYIMYITVLTTVPITLNLAAQVQAYRSNTFLASAPASASAQGSAQGSAQASVQASAQASAQAPNTLQYYTCNFIKHVH